MPKPQRGDVVEAVLPAAAPGTRRNRHGAILTAAIAVFSERGYAAASLQDVADAVGLLKGSLYHYISSKENLLYEIVQDWYVQALQLMKGIDELELTTDARLREFVRQLTLFYAQDADRASLYFSEWRHLTGAQHETVLGQRRAFEQYVLRLIQAVEADGLARDGLEPKLAARYLLTAVNGIVLWYRPDGQWPATKIAEEYADMACAAILRPRVVDNTAAGSSPKTGRRVRRRPASS